MKKRNLLLLPLFALLLAGCRQPDVSQDPVSSEPPVSVTSETPTTSEDPTSVPVSDEDSIPEPPTSEAPVYPKRTIEELRAMTGEGESASEAQKEQKYETSGIVTAKFRGANIRNVGPAWNIAIQDGEHALLLYAITEADYAAHFAAVPVGSKLTVTGHLAAYGGLRELDRIGYVSHEEATAVVPEVLTDVKKEALVGKDSKLVKIEGLKLHAKPTLEAYMDGDYTNITLDMDLRLGDTKIGTYMHYNIPIADAEATMEVLRTVTSNSTVNWTGVIGMNKGDYQLTNAHVSEWEVEVGEPVVLSNLAFEEATKDLNKNDTYQTKLVATPFDGPTTGLEYASSNEAVATVDEAGKVTAVAAGTTNVTATVGAFVATVAVTVLDEVSTDITLSVESLGLDGVAYDASDFKGDTAKDVGGVKFGVFGVADYGDGLQWRLKSTSSIWNETEFEGAIASITVQFNSAKDYPGKLDLFTSEDEAISTVQTVSGETVGDGSTLFTATATFDLADDIHFFRLQYPVADYTYTNYISEIVVTLHPAA